MNIQTCPCPGHHRGCLFVGATIQQTIRHMRENRRCIQILTPPHSRDGLTFSSWIGDYNNSRTIFDSPGTTMYKPVLLYSTWFVRFHVYMIIQRISPGFWTIFFRCLAHTDRVKNLRAKLSLYKETLRDTPSFSFTGKIHHTNKDSDLIYSTGDYMVLTDPQVRSMKNGNILFKYSIELFLIPEGQNNSEIDLLIHD